ncbi:MAG: GerAB/ArcD/ProY family transporter [Halanaerobiales bacterium]|nr:GerAB/ArcD/ProY family transporter [Halanaerobiales bacterium]
MKKYFGTYLGSLIGVYDLNNLFPVLERGILPVLNAAFGIVSFSFGEVIVFLMIFPNVNNKKNIVKISYLSFLIAGGLLFMITLRNIFVLGSDLLLRGVYPSFLSTKLFPVIDIDPFVAVDLLIAGVVKISVFMYGAVVGLIQIFNLDDYKLFILPISTIIVGLSIWVFDNVFEMQNWIS